LGTERSLEPVFELGHEAAWWGRLKGTAVATIVRSLALS